MLGDGCAGRIPHVLVGRHCRLVECARDALSDADIGVLLCEGANTLSKTTGRRRRAVTPIRGDAKRDMDLEAAIVLSWGMLVGPSTLKLFGKEARLRND
jgi:hypothetical protein